MSDYINLNNLSIYFGLDEGKSIDFEIAAKASLAYIAAIKEISYLLDPAIEIRVELKNGTEGSLFLNSTIKYIRNYAATHPVNFKAICISAALLLGEKVVELSWQHIVDATGLSPEIHITEADKQDIVQKTMAALESKIAQTHVQEFYRQVDRDPNIQAVGISHFPSIKPAIIIQRSEFAQKHTPIETHEILGKRTRRTRVQLILTRPHLNDLKKQWKFIGPEGEISVYMKDAEFLADVLEGRKAIPMVRGIIIEADLQTKEEMKNNVWRVTSRSVLRVHNVTAPPIQQSLLLTNPNPPTPTERSGNDDNQDQ
jgi:hypothetical protein